MTSRAGTPAISRPREEAPGGGSLEALLEAQAYGLGFDLAGIAGPVFGPEREILGSIGVIMPSPRFQLHMEDDLATAVRDAARELSHQARISYS